MKAKFLFAIASLMLCSCHSQKAVSTATAEETALNSSRRETNVTVNTDTLVRSLALSFDTLDVWIEDRQAATLPEDEHSKRVRLRAVRGSLATNQQQKSSATQLTTATDTASVAHSGTRESETSEKQTSVYRPPDLTWLFGIAIVILCAAALYIYRSRRKS